MITRRYKIVTIALISAGIGSWSFAGRARPAPEFVEAVAADSLDRLPIGDPEIDVTPLEIGAEVVVDVAALVDHLDILTVDERPQQIADWAVYGTVLQHGGDAETITDALYDRSPMRDPGLVDVINYDYGPGRHVYVGDDQVWLFYSDYDPHPEVTLARLADTVRMERGEAPTQFQIYKFRSEIAEQGTIKVTREPDVSGDAMFSDDFGYHEAVINDILALEQWLNTIDDVSHVAIQGNEIRAGGRRFAAAPTHGVDVDDIAVLYKAHLAGNVGPGFSLDPQAKPAKLIEALERLLSSPDQIIAEAKALVEASAGQAVDPAAEPIALQRARHIVEYVGDRTYIPTVRATKLIRETVSTLRELQAPGSEQVSAALATRLERLLLAQDPATAYLTRYVVSRAVVQCARYDGPVRGTRAAMTMFYTDLMMKVWESADYHRSAPSRHVPGFLTSPDVTARLDPVYMEEFWRLSSTRIWLGPRNDGYSLSTSGTLDFAPIAIRLYAAGSNPLQIGEESEQVNEPSRLTIGWWHRHYADVADYEQEYHRQNQLMKWSLITAQLAKTGVLDALRERSVPNHHDFETWYRTHEQLVFQKDVRLLDRVDWVGDTECMELLVSRPVPDPEDGSDIWIEGGVSLGRQATLKSTRLLGSVDDVPKALGRGSVVSRNSSGAVYSSQRGLYKFVPNGIGRSRVALTPKGAPRYRRFGSDLTLSRVDSSLAMRGRTAAIEVRIDTGVLGKFEARRASGRVALQWSDGAVGRQLAPRAASAAGETAGPSGKFLGELARADASAAARELRTLAKTGELDAMTADLAARMETLRKAGIRENPLAMPEVMQVLSKEPSAAEHAALQTLAKHRDGVILPNASARLPPRFAEAVRDAGRRRPTVRRPVSNAPEMQLAVKPAGTRIVSVLEVKPSQVQKLKGSARDDALETCLKSGDVDIYVERAGHLRELDFDGLPLQSLSRLAKDPRVEWLQVMDGKIATARPDRLTYGGTEMALQTTGHSAPMSLAPNPVFSPSRPVIMIRLASSDDDTQPEDDEEEDYRGR